MKVFHDWLSINLSLTTIGFSRIVKVASFPSSKEPKLFSLNEDIAAQIVIPFIQSFKDIA